MRITAFIFGLLAIGLGTASAQDCHLKQFGGMAFTATPQGLVLPVKFGTVEKDLAFDLGNASNALNADVVHDLGLHQSTIAANTHVHRDGVNIYYSARARHIAIDGAAFDNVDFLVLPAGAESRLGGAIGTRQFQNADIELDMAGGRINLFDSNHCPGQAVYWTSTGFVKLPLEIDDHGYIRAQLRLDGKPVTLALNSEGGSFIGMNALRRIFGLDASSPGMTLDRVSDKGVRFFRYDFRTLETDGLAISHPAIMVRDEPEGPGCVAGQHPFTNGGPATGGIQTNLLRETSCYGQADGELGLSVLKKLHLYISKKEKLLYLTGAGAH